MLWHVAQKRRLRKVSLTSQFVEHVVLSLPNEQVASAPRFLRMRHSEVPMVERIGNTRLNREWREDDATR